MRGVIAAPGTVQVLADRTLIGGQLSPEQIRYYALYWDKIVIPTNNIVHKAVPDEDLLIESGVIERPQIRFTGSFSGPQVGMLIYEAQAQVASSLLQDAEPNQWTIHQFGTTLMFPDSYLVEDTAVRMDLLSAIPVPRAEVSLVDIFEFKLRRHDELRALHDCLDKMYIAILESPDQHLAIAKAKAELEEAVKNVNRVANERWETTTKYDFSAHINLDGAKIMSGAGVGAVLDALLLTHGIPIATAVCGLASVIKIKAGVTKSFTAAKVSKSTSLSYLSNASRESIVDT
jgi:hypothetical protein